MEKEVTIKMQLEITLNVDSDYDTENLKNLASLIVSDNLECQLDTSYDNETFVSFNISNVEEVK